jgi:hypothetical protein
MDVPGFVARAARRVLAWTGVLALGVAAAGFVGEHWRFGRDAAAARERVAADVERQFGTLRAELDDAISRVQAGAALTRAVASAIPPPSVSCLPSSARRKRRSIAGE